MTHGTTDHGRRVLRKLLPNACPLLTANTCPYGDNYGGPYDNHSGFEYLHLIGHRFAGARQWSVAAWEGTQQAQHSIRR